MAGGNVGFCHRSLKPPDSVGFLAVLYYPLAMNSPPYPRHDVVQ
jgi:hypothetical protein